MELRRDGVVVVGHRGAAALAPENTLEAIEAAAACGADAVELDVLAAPHGLVLAHGPALPPAAPALDEALALVRRLGLAVQLDLKTPEVAAGAAAALRRHALLEQAFVSSCSPLALHAVAAAEPSLPRAFTYPEDRHGLSGRPLLRPAVACGLGALRVLLPARLPGLLRAAGAQAATLNRQVVTRAAIAACHRAGAAAYAWTVNDPGLAATLVESGIDGIISDDPRIVSRGIRQ